MKRYFSLFLCVVLMLSFFAVNASAAEDDAFVPYIIDFSIVSDVMAPTATGDSARVTGLIQAYRLAIENSGNTLHIVGQTYGSTEVIKSGFKDLTVQRRKSSAYDWEDYYEYGNVYRDAANANLDTTLAVASGYQYRVTCKHYAKKSLLSTQTISNTSNIVTVA